MGRQRYTMSVCGERAGQIATCTGFSITVSHGLGALRRAETIVVPGIDDLTLPIPDAVLRALVQAYERGVRLVSICTGAFVLAAAGVLDGRRATTHWLDAPALAERYPAITVDPDVLYIDEGDVLTSTGITAGVDLCLHVVRKDYGAAVANAVAGRCGFGSAVSLRAHFRREFRTSPLAYRRAFRRGKDGH